MQHRFTALLAAAALAAMFGSACYRHAIIVDGATSGPADAGYYTHHVLWGLVNVSGSRSVGAFCSDGVAELRVKANGITALTYFFLGGLYNPTRVKVWCSEHYRSAVDTGVFPEPDSTPAGEQDVAVADVPAE